MCALRRVEADRAGPGALGVLVPPARRTFLILRPRSLDWDLVLLAAADDSTFRVLAPEQANAAARELVRALESWPATGSGRVEAIAVPGGTGYWLRARVEGFHLLACPRLPGQPYRPLVFEDAAAVRAAAESVTAVLCPPAGVDQEWYFNTRNFAR